MGDWSPANVNGGSISAVSAPHDGTDASTALNALITEASARGVASGVPCVLDGGGFVFTVADTVILKKYVCYRNMTLKLADNVNTDTTTPATYTSVATNNDHTGGDEFMRFENFAVDGNKANQTYVFDDANPTYSVHLHRCGNLGLRDVDVGNSDSTGLFVTGGDDSGTPVQTRVVHYSNVVVHDCAGDGLWTGNAMREVYYGGAFGRFNGFRGVVIDHSEAFTSAVEGYGNTGRGIWVRNVHGCNLNGLAAHFNGGHGIYAVGINQSGGVGWSAHNNGQVTTGCADIYFDDTDLGYGPTNECVICGVAAGYDPNWPGGQLTDWNVYVADGLAAKSLKIIGLHPQGGALTTEVHVPTSSTELYVSGFSTANQAPTVWAGADDTPVTKTANYSMTVTDRLVYANAGGITISLPDPTVASTGRRFTIKNIGSGSVAVNSQGTSKTIDGRSTLNLNSGDRMTVESNGTEWKIISGASAPITLTKTANYNMVVTDDVVIGNGASITISLPGPGNCAPGHRYIVKNINSSSLTVNSQGTSKTIDGAASVTLAQWASLVVFTDGSAWYSV